MFSMLSMAKRYDCGEESRARQKNKEKEVQQLFACEVGSVLVIMSTWEGMAELLSKGRCNWKLMDSHDESSVYGTLPTTWNKVYRIWLFDIWVCVEATMELLSRQVMSRHVTPAVLPTMGLDFDVASHVGCWGGGVMRCMACQLHTQREVWCSRYSRVYIYIYPSCARLRELLPNFAPVPPGIVCTAAAPRNTSEWTNWGQVSPFARRLTLRERIVLLEEH